jgi:hypothetical protein
MARFYSILIAGLLFFTSIDAMANINISFGSAPPNREVIVPPRGYVTCHNVAADYSNGVWVNQHQVCRYSQNRGMWVSGHWQCIQGIPRKGICLRWDWVPSYWERGHHRVDVYNPPMPRPAAYPAPAVAYAPQAVQRPPMPVPMPVPVPVGAEQQPAASPVAVGQVPAQRV